MRLYKYREWRLGLMTETSEATTGGTNGSGEENKNGSIIFTMPMELKAMIENAAKESNKPVGAYVRGRVAELFGYELPATQHGRARKYATVEERLAAQKPSSRNATNSSRNCLRNTAHRRLVRLRVKLRQLAARANSALR